MTRPTTIYEPGDIVLVPFPFTDQSASKKRPAVVVSSALFNRDRPDAVLLAVTSQVRAAPFSLLINDWQEAGLLAPSALKPILFTIEKPLMIRKLGRLSERDRLSLKGLLAQILL